MSEPSDNELTSISQIPKEIQELLRIRLLGDHFVEYTPEGLISCYIYEGKKYYERSIPFNKPIRIIL